MSMSYLSRIENILEAKVNGIEYTEPPQSRIEQLLIQLSVGGGGGGGSTPDLTNLTNRVTQLETKVNNQDAAITTLANDLDGATTAIGDLTMNYSAVRTDVDVLQETVAELDVHAIIDNVPETTASEEET